MAQQTMAYSDFMQEAKAGRIKEVQIDGQVIHARTQDDRPLVVYATGLV